MPLLLGYERSEYLLDGRFGGVTAKLFDRQLEEHDRIAFQGGCQRRYPVDRPDGDFLGSTEVSEPSRTIPEAERLKFETGQKPDHDAPRTAPNEPEHNWNIRCDFRCDF